MNYGISILFRAIPLLMALFCFGYGAFVLDMGTDTNRFVAGPVVFSLGMICIALFATAGTIIRQIIHTYSTAAKYALPIIGYLAAVVCFIGGMTYINDGSTVAHFVAGHVICGVAFITACVATTATSSTRFTFITQNSKKTDHAYLPSHSLRHRRTYSSFWLLSSPSLHGFGHSGYWDKVISTPLTMWPDTLWPDWHVSVRAWLHWLLPLSGRYVTLIVVPNGNGGPPSYW